MKNKSVIVFYAVEHGSAGINFRELKGPTNESAKDNLDRLLEDGWMISKQESHGLHPQYSSSPTPTNNTLCIIYTLVTGNL